VTQAQQDVVQAQRGVKGAVTSAGTNTGQAMSKVKAAGTMSAKATDSVTEAAQTVAKEVAGTRHDKPLSEHTKAQLYELATERDIQGRSSMNKDELLAALKKDDR
jgi:DNA end-binding protein Ku